jgi:hypothetical protein
MKQFYFITLTLFLGFIGQSAYAQRGYESGYVITNKGDTLHGMISDRKEGSFTQLYKRVKLKGNGLLTKKFGPNEITAYKKGTENFESHWLKQRGGLLKEEYLSESGQGKKVFLQLMVSGYLSLYHLEYTDQESNLFEFIPLLKRQDENYFVRATQGVFGLKKKNLAAYFADCAALVELMNRGELKSAEAIVQYYNEWYSDKSN